MSNRNYNQFPSATALTGTELFVLLQAGVNCKVNLNTMLTLSPSVRITGGTYSAGTTTLTNNTGGTISITGFSTGGTFVDTYSTGGTPNNSTKTYTFTNNTGGTFNVNALTDISLTGGTYTAGTTTLVNSTGGTITINGYFVPVNQTPITLAEASPIVWNMNSSYNASVTLTQNRNLSITNPVAGTYGTLKVTQGGFGSNSIFLPANSKVINGSAGLVYLSTFVGAVDILTYYYDGVNFYWNLGKLYN